MSEPVFGPADADTLKADIEQLKADLASLKDHGKEFGAAKAGEARGLLEEKVHQLQKEIDRVTAEIKKQGEEARAKLERNVHERPLTSLAIAFGVGFIAAKLLR
ncbi:Membrane-anchored ribosome-binding protein, inhibits growth in stationary phase, ElaB/YqjD/DUF883 family [Arboricoccus pini]|uniref:Membrane-anchored ribosome-binding protein, inhibits growth in stationary phase, ElaB/YqjD/DUF883 family n=1 Tax=Arboricoccus pini TaxID=1963835 RepID=A0A212RSX4_9PROT|nr:DUF883 family protein [Arboricoccus pini]SNB75810.1 Membrane-anchored ribosome-binding protein, inhibits growth in stationary phase, ElaB/YqjD/DUF883 family [Arboricoccus pini]